MSLQTKYVDKLYEILLDLELCTYLQGLVEFDSDVESVFENEFNAVTKNAQSYLFEKQLEAVKNLDRLLRSENFNAFLNGKLKE